MNSIDQNIKQIDGIRIVKKSYFYGILSSILIALLGLISSTLINHFYPLGEMTIKLLQALSKVPGTASLFAVPGWDIQTWAGNSSVELLNRKLYNRFGIMGLFLLVFAFSLSSSTINGSSVEIKDNSIAESDVSSPSGLSSSITPFQENREK